MINNLFANNNTNQPNIFQNNNNQNNNNNSSNIFNRSGQNIFQSQNNNGQVNIFNANNNNNQVGYQNQSQNIFQQNSNMNNASSSNNNNIFGNNISNNNNYGGAQNNNIFNNNNQNMYQNSNNPNALIGSQRGKYELTKSPHTETQQNNQAGVIMNTSIIFCKGFEKMNPLLVRLEDYYLIRTGKLSDAEKQKITSSIQINSFNQNLITNLPQNFQPPNTQALNKDIRMVQSQYVGNVNNNNNIFNNNNNNGNNNNIFANNNNVNNSVNRNIFNNNNISTNNNINNNNNGNIFNNNNNNMNNNGGNIFSGNNNQNNNVNNIFSFNNSQNNNMNKSNIFNNGNSTNNTSNIFQNNNTNMGNNSIFQGNNNNNNNNIFRNDNSTNNTNLNIFSNNNNNINNSIFRNNNNNNTNIFNNGNNNGGNNTSSIFNNSGSNNSVNIFRSNNNNNGGSIFSNNNNSSVQNIFQKNNSSIFNNNNNNGGSIFNNNNSIFGPNVQGGNIFQNNNNNNFNNGNIFTNYNNPQMYQSNLPGPANGYYSIQSGMYYAPTIQTGDLTRQQYLDLLEQEAEDKKVVKQSYFMPSFCPEEYAPAFRKKPIFKPFYVTVQEEKGIRKLAKSLLPLQETIAKTQRGHSSETTSNGKNDSFQLTQSAIKQRKQMEEFNFYKQPAQETKGREMYARQQLSHTNPVSIKVEVLCSTLEGEEEEITLENQIDTLSKIKQIGLYCKDHLLKMGKMKEDSRPYSFQIYYDGSLIRNQELLASDVFPVKLEATYQCEVIFLYDRYPFMNTSDYIINPPLEELQTYSLKELKNVHNFSVEGHYGKLEWQEPVDLTDLDIDKTIYIRDQQIQVYPEVEYASKYKPKVGEGINNKCMITYKNASSIQRKIKSGELNLQTVIKCIKKQSDEQNVQFVKFDQKNLTWTILVDHFSGYQFNLDEQDDEENKEGQDSAANLQNVSSNSNSRSNPSKQQQLIQGQQQFNQDSQRTANQQLQQQQLQAENQFQQKINSSYQQLPMRQHIQNSNQFKQIYGQNEHQPSETQKYINQMREQQNVSKSQENSFIQQDYPITSHQQQNSNYQMNEHNQYQNQPSYMNRGQLQQQQYYGTHIDPSNDIIIEEVENGSYNNTQADIDTLKSQAQELIEPVYQLPKTSYQQFLRQQNNEEQFVNLQNKQKPLNNFKDFKTRVDQRKNKIFQKEQQVPKCGVLYQSVKKHEIVARGIQTLNQCLYQHSVKEYTFKGKKFYNDFSFCPSWNQNSYTSYSSKLKAIKKHTILPNNMGRIKIKDKQRDQIEKYNNIVINGFLQSIIDSQATNVIENIDQITKLYTKDQGMSDTQIWSTLPEIKIPTDNQYTLFLIIYIKNYLLPVLSASKNNQNDLYQSLKEELSILIMVNILFGNPQIDVISILKKVNKNSFSENQWKVLFEGLRNNKMNQNEKVVQNLRKKQLKKYFEWKYSENKVQINEQRAFLDMKEMKTQEEVEDAIIQCLKNHQIQNAIQLADNYKLHTISHLLTTFEQGSVENQIKQLNQDKYQNFNRIINFVSGNLEELYKQSQRNEISNLNKFACEIWYQKNQRQSLAETFDQFVQKVDKQIYDVDSRQQIISLEILLLSLYAQHQLGENYVSKQLVNINIFAQINSQCYSQNRLDKRLSWFIIEFMNSVYFSNDKALLKDKRARLMRGFLQQLQILKKWKYELIVLIIMKDIIRKPQFISSIKNTFLRNCIPQISQEDKSEVGQPNNLNNKFLIQSSNRDSSSDNSLEINKSFQIDSENSNSVERLLYLIYTQYFHQSLGLYYYNSQIYQSALYHFMRDPNLTYLDISNKILAYYEGPRIYLFGEQNERQEIEKYLEQIAKKANLIFKYKYQSGLIKEVFSLLQSNNQDQYKQEYINGIINLKDLLLETQNVLNLVIYPHQYQVIVDNQEFQSKNRRLQSKTDDSVTTLDNGGMLFQEFISFIFQQLAEKVPDIRRYSQHYQTSGDIQQLLEIVSEHKAPKNEQIKHLILSTLKQNQYM
ncbi:nucleoporin, putative (macronuclear) [Tetrahymena thermophila SB210]|uniref:Nucleoporin, putative n=1 Tax=Tetrahymena thermophila (strain SB210) TaxID=312017 RepID=I7LTE8_TETTS|nr:nucleoporin, putative [Tetrahymena thermophila SB210]EAR85114.2 nucleoporin, putative [Tetrahymena thermophila SB210]|eukprot:XP_001032777.2 nucleoporin, putative [Tetrahymena thermophila SB210]